MKTLQSTHIMAFLAVMMICLALSYELFRSIDQTQALREAQQKASEQSLERMKWSRPSDIVKAITEGK